MSLLILTVGTGTAGKHSDVAAGLARTIDLTAPKLFWLVPSASEKSRPVADLIRESVTNPGAFCPWSTTAAYCAIQDPDDLHQCRAVVREVIAHARQQLKPGERLIVNPTSGTKQMSAGATLAALDEEIGELMFTVGERVDGVVKTGTEQAKTFSTEAFFFARDLRIAESLFEHGAFFAAAQLLRRHHQPDAMRARETALCLHEWQRMSYAKAATHAARFSEDLRLHLQQLADADPFGASVLGDLLAGADELLRWGDCEEALARYYRGAEHAAKVSLAEAYSLRPASGRYRVEDLRKLLPNYDKVAAELRLQPRNSLVQLTAQRAWDVLEAAQDPMAAAYNADQKLAEGLQRRNESMYGHGHEPVDGPQVQAVAARLRQLLRQHLPAAEACWSTVRRPRALAEPRPPA
jgi:hypothetical protein